MLKNYLLIAYRNLLGNRLFSVINILGLAIGLAACMLILLFVRHELTYDQQFENGDRIFRVTRTFFGNDLNLATVAPPIGPLLAEEFPEIQAMTRLMDVGDVPVQKDGKVFTLNHVAMADENAFEFFGFRFLHGNPDSALNSPTDMVVTQSTAQRYFGRTDVVGETLFIFNQTDVKITGVIEDLPENTHMAINAIGSIKILPSFMGPDEMDNWGSNNYYTYLLLPGGDDGKALEARFPDFLIKHRGENAPSGTALYLQRLTDIHLHSNLDAEWRANGSITAVYTFSAIALVILLIACINFMNLTTARSTQRAKEVGVRKVVGASRGQLIVQFLGESILLTGIAMLLALAIVELLLPLFANYVEKPLSLDVVSDAGFIPLLVASVLVVGILAGSYPAFYLSSFRPVDVLKGSASSSGSVTLRKILVVLQFSISIGLMIATGVVVAQMEYARSLDLGYDRSRTMTTSLPILDGFWNQYAPLKAALEASPLIESVTASSRIPTAQLLDGSGYFIQGQPLEMENVKVLADLKVDYNWFEQYGVNLVAGRYFRDVENERIYRPPSDEDPIVKGGVAILNESAVRLLGWTPEEAIGKVLIEPDSPELDRLEERTVVGVVEDFYFSSLHDEIKSVIFVEMNPDYSVRVSVKLKPGDPRLAAEFLDEVWKQQFSHTPADWRFLEDTFDALYRGEERQAEIFSIFAGLAIFVSTLGLFGLASFTTERRTKEIGIRKVMGASVKDIVLLLTRDFTGLVVLANVFAWPVAYFFMREWLTQFAYSVPLSFGVFLGAGIAAILVAWLTVATQATKAATSRPVFALRYE